MNRVNLVEWPKVYVIFSRLKQPTKDVGRLDDDEKGVICIRTLGGEQEDKVNHNCTRCIGLLH